MKDKIKNIRELFFNSKIDAYIIPSTDEFLSEHPPVYTKRLEYIIDLNCSNGFLFISNDQVLFLTDARYIDASKELEDENFKIVNIKNINTLHEDDFFKNINSIGYNEEFFTSNILSAFKKLPLQKISDDLVVKTWINRPPKPSTKIFEYTEKYSGESFQSKLESYRKILKNNGAEAGLVTSCESVCWITNLRAKDNEFSPIILSLAYIDFERVILFSQKRDIPKGSDLEVKDFSDLDDFLKNINKKILIPEDSNLKIQNFFKDSQKIITKDPIQLLKARKNDIEINNFKEIHRIDAASLIEFYCWLEKNIPNKNEYEIGIKLSEIRANNERYIIDSFPVICGFRGNGAKIHYRAKQKGSSIVKGDGLLLIDSGAHYLGGTTDVTRTTNIGTPKLEHKNYYTRVLKGHIALASIKFPLNISGANLDVLARKSLWDIGLDYPHGTGHGVGNALSVHEGPQSINLRNNIILEEGMVISNEPGFYKNGELGIRIENMQFVKKSAKYNNFLEFDQLTLVPYCKDLINFDILDVSEKEFLTNYNNKILEEVGELLDESSLKYLKTKI